MPFSDPALPLRDILHAIINIQEFTKGMNFDAFRSDQKTAAAVERKVLVISEAASRLGVEADRICPGPRWREIRGIGNWIRHQYDDVDINAIWNTLQKDLPPLKTAVQKALTPVGE